MRVECCARGVVSCESLFAFIFIFMLLTQHVTADSDTIERREPDVNISHVRVHVDSLHVDRAGPSAET